MACALLLAALWFPLGPFLCSLRRNEERGREREASCLLRSGKGRPWLAPQHGASAVPLCNRGQAAQNRRPSDSHHAGDKPGSGGGGAYHIWCRKSDCRGLRSWHSSRAALLSLIRASSLWLSSGSSITAWQGCRWRERPFRPGHQGSLSPLMMGLVQWGPKAMVGVQPWRVDLP